MSIVWSGVVAAFDSVVDLVAGEHPSSSRALAAVTVAALVARLVAVPLVGLQLRAIRAQRRAALVFRGVVAEVPDAGAMASLCRRASSPWKDPIPALAIQAPVLLALYFAVRDFAREAGHLGSPARDTFGGLVLIAIVISTAWAATAAASAHLDDPAARRGAMVGPMVLGAVFFAEALPVSWALAFAVYGLGDRLQQRLVLAGTPAPPPAPTMLRGSMATRHPGRPLLACRDIRVSYGKVPVLHGVDIAVHQGEILALLGTNGAGKSTLLRAVSGLADEATGTICFDGADIGSLDAIERSALGIAQVPGGKSVFPTLTVDENLRAASWLRRSEHDDVAAAVAEVKAMFPVLEDRAGQLAGNLSGGEQQMLGLGMAFLARPKLLLVDELSLGLAPAVVAQLLEIVRAIHRAGATVVLVEQSVNLALTLADRAYFMEKGQVRFEGPTAELLAREDLLRSVFLHGAASNGGEGAPAPSAVARRPVGAEAGPPALEARSLRKQFGGIRAVDDVSFAVAPGEIVGLIGPNGSGKTTILDLVSGFVPLDGGRLVLEGRDLTSVPPAGRALAGLGRSFQDSRIFPALTVAENLAVSLERHLEVRDHLAAALHLPAVQEIEEDIAWTVSDLVELVGLGPFRDKLASELSTGSRRLVDLAMSIGHSPSVLLLDEPSSGIAQRETEALGPVLLRLRDETGCSLLVVEHDMPLIIGISDRLIALETGHVIAEGPPESVVCDPTVVRCYLGADSAAIDRSGPRVATGTRRRAQPLRARA